MIRGSDPVGMIASRMTSRASPKATAQASPRRMRSKAWTVLTSAVRSVPVVWTSSSMPGIREMSWTMPPNVHDTTRLTRIVRGQPTGTPSSRREMNPRMSALISAAMTTKISFTRPLSQE